MALQIKGGAGIAALIPATAGLMCLGVVALSLKNGKKDITKSDTVVAILSLMAIGFWLIANQPILSMILVITADLLAFVPTVRKSYRKPYSETLSLYVTNTIRFLLALMAVETFTFLSAAWFAAWVVGNALFSIMLVVRRKQVRR